VITRRVGDVDYEVVCSDRGGATQIYHLNLLKAWREAKSFSLVSVVSEREELGPEVQKWPHSFVKTNTLGPREQTLPSCNTSLLTCSLSCLPGRTNLIMHQIETPPGVTVQTPPNRLPEHKIKVVLRELMVMLELGVIEESHSAWCSSIVLVVKKDRSIQFCMEYRRVNDVSCFKCTQCLGSAISWTDLLGTAHFFKTLDLTKSY